MNYAHILKANPYHDERGRFTTEDKAKFVSTSGKFADRVDPADVWFHGGSEGENSIGAKETHLKPGIDGALWLTKDKSKAEHYARTTADRKGGIPVVYSVRGKDAPQDETNWGSDMVRATVLSPKIVGKTKLKKKSAFTY